MNILYLSRTMGQGGAERIVYQLATETAEQGANVFVASCGGVYVEMLEAKGIRHIQLQDLEDKNLGTILDTVTILAKTVRTEKIDIIHTHHRMAQFYALILKFAFPKVKVIYTAHNVFFDKVFFTKMVLQRTSIVAVGDGVKDNLIKVFGVKANRVSVIYNGVFVEKPEETYLDDTLKDYRVKGTKLVGVIGRLSEQKGIDIFIDVIKEIRSQDIEVKGVIIGDGEEKDKVRKWIYDKELENDIIMMGYQNHIPTLINQLDLVVMPSRWEGFPLLPFEIFSAHKTLVASDIGGINEIVKHMENGILVQKDNTKAFSEAVLRLLGDTELKVKLENNGEKTFEKYNHYKDFLNQYYQLYLKVIGEK